MVKEAPQRSALSTPGKVNLPFLTLSLEVRVFCSAYQSFMSAPRGVVDAIVKLSLRSGELVCDSIFLKSAPQAALNESACLKLRGCCGLRRRCLLAKCIIKDKPLESAAWIGKKRSSFILLADCSVDPDVWRIRDGRAPPTQYGGRGRVVILCSPNVDVTVHRLDGI